MKTMKILVIVIGVLITYLCFFILAVRSERKLWNGGICPKCGSKLRHFGTDHTNADGWECENKECNHEVWVSYGNLVYNRKTKHEK